MGSTKQYAAPLSALHITEMRSLSRARGIALITVLLLTTVCLMLLGAFLVNHRSYITSFKGGQSRDAIGLTTRSLYEYCVFRLEESKSWAIASPSDNSLEVGELDIQEIRKEGPAFHLSGFDRANGTQFSVEVINNIEGLSIGHQGVPPRNCRLTIKVWRGGHRGGAQIFLRRAAFFDSSAIASESLNVNTQFFLLDSKDPIRNQIRSLGNMELGRLHNDGGTSRFFFRPDADSQNVSRGTVWARGDIALRDASAGVSDSLGAAAELTGAEWIEQGKTHYEIPKLTREDLTNTADRQALDIEPGTYMFTRSPVDVQFHAGGPWHELGPEVHMLEHWEGSPGEGGSVQEVQFLKANLIEAVQLATGLAVLPYNTKLREHPEAEINSRYLVEDNFEIQDGMRVNLLTKQIEIDADRNAQVNGDIEITTDQWDILPTLRFTSVESWDRRGSLSATGSIKIRGVVSGVGNLIAGDDLEIAPNFINQDVEEGSSPDDSDSQSNIALFAGNDVSIRPPGGAYGRQRNIMFRGLVYAENNFTFDAGWSSSYGSQNLRIEGALVARSGSININNAQTTHLIYNPEYLEDLLQNWYDERAKVELIGWRPL